MRKYYIDNLRWIIISLLFFFFFFMIYNSFGEKYYIKGIDNIYLSYVWDKKISVRKI
jgi:hypothetical protein